MADDDADSDDGRDPFGPQSPPLTDQIASVLRRYPDGGQILKELIQNADDAGAREVRFLLDPRRHSTEDVFDRGLSKYQGPALYAWNDAVFKRDDWQFLGRIEQSGKKKQVLKVGRFGLGFLSVFHITDMPMVISRKYVGITDPHKALQIVRDKDESGAGKRVKLIDFLNHRGHVDCLSDIFEMRADVVDYNATLFRFPLRENGSDSKISPNCYTPEKVRENLFASLQEEAPILLLFLQSVVKVSMYEWNEASSSHDCLFSMEITGNVSQNRKKCKELAESYDQTSSTTRIVTSSVTTTTCAYSGGESKEYHWLLMNAIGSDVQELREHALKTSVLPWVGIAAPTPTDFNICALHFDLDAISDATSNSGRVLSTISGEIRKTICEAGKLSNQTSTAGQAFCFLPLPGSISLPVNLHGYFAVADNRRSIKWPSHDEKGEEAKWNELLLLKLVSPLYALMLACRCSLVDYSGPSPDAYAAWPVYAEVKNQQIWSHILDPVLNQLANRPILLAKTKNGAAWVTLKQAHFIDAEKDGPPQIALRKLIELEHNVVRLPPTILETMLSNQEMNKIITTRYVSEDLVREALRGKNNILSSEKREEMWELLKYILCDQPNLHSLRDLEVLPLNKATELASFNGERVFLFPQKHSEALKFLPGISSSTVDVEIPPDLQLLLEELAGEGNSSLTLVTEDTICSELITLSMKSWFPHVDMERKCLWQPGQSNHPPLQWISGIWQWIQTHQAVLQVCGIPLVPTEAVSASTREVNLVPLDTSPGLCTLHTGTLTCSATELLSIIKEMGLHHIPYSQCVFNCPGTSQYIKKVDAHLLLKHVDKLQLYSLSSGARDCLREYIAFNLNRTSKLTRDEITTVRKLPIFEAGVGCSTTNYVSIDSDYYVLPPHGVTFSSSIDYPPNILCDDRSQVTALLEKLDTRKIASIDDFCSEVILPHVTQSNMHLSHNDDNLIMWVLQRPISKPAILSRFSIIKPCVGDYRRKPSELYDPDEDIFKFLFDSGSDPEFPHSCYRPVLRVLREAGLITWSTICRNRGKMITFFTERAQSITSLPKQTALERSKYLLQRLLQHNLIVELSHIPFLFPQATPPQDYPTSLMWHGSSCNEPICPREVCATTSEAFEVGSVVPVLSSQYKVRERQNGFHSIAPEERVTHFQEVVKCRPNSESESEKVHSMIMKVYRSVVKNVGRIPTFSKTWIWWKHRREFLSPDQCVFSLPPDIGSLEPYLFNLYMNPDLHMLIKALLPILSQDIKQSLGSEQAISVLNDMKKSKGDKLTSVDVQIALRILNWLKSSGANTHGNILVPTSSGSLVPVSECTYNDRNWDAKTRKAKFTFVHEDVSMALARYLKVPPLSLKLAPAQALKIKYTKTGQKEPVTQRIKRIVEDYATSSDIFKELLQNADDAKATEVKFLIDWRQHPASSLFTEEVANWQGPALIAYNNAVFSDQDFDHICELAGETKMKDPLKTGRFGVGFCATYRLTDLPSFISRQYFTMFDPHTTYLGDRVSTGEPGMRIDLLENMEDLCFYKDQFLPYDGLFGCNVFNLSEGGFKGTLFRFPFRSYTTAFKSNICQEIINTDNANELIQAFLNQASYLLLFLKHVQKVSLYVLNKDETNVSNMEPKGEVCRKCDCFPSCKRLTLLSPHDNLVTNICHTMTECVKHGERVILQTSKWVVGSAVTPTVKQEKERGLIPFAEVAVPVSKDDNMKLFPQSVEGYTFCFLPLPMKTGLPFHVNGFFEIGRDRSALKSTDDGRFGKQWNDDLCKEPLMHAFIAALSELAIMSPLSQSFDEKMKEKYLKAYYDLFKVSNNAGFSSLSSSMQKALPKSNQQLIWSDVEDGQWLKPKDVILLDFPPFAHKMLKPSTAVLLCLKYKVCNLPGYVANILIQYLKQRETKQVFNCPDFYAEVLLPNISHIPSDLRDKHIIFLLENLDRQRWIEPLLKTHKFVPVEECPELVHPTYLIDERKPLMASLFDTNEGRFPKIYLQSNERLMLGLRQVGMPVELSVQEIQGRAQTIINISNKEKVLKRSWTIVSYIQSHFRGSNQKLTNAICRIRFLPVACKPPSLSIPWWELEELVEPRRVFKPTWNNLVFSVCPVVNPPAEYAIKPDTVTLLGASPDPPLERILAHLLNLSKESTSFNEEAMPFISQVVKEIYAYLRSKMHFYHSNNEVTKVKTSLDQRAFIWQGKKFLKADQVVMKWDKDLYPYLCGLSSENSSYRELFAQLGVKEQPSADDLARILQTIAGKIQLDVTENEAIQSMPPERNGPVSQEVIGFIEEIVKRLSQLTGTNEPPQDLYLPDEECVMRPVQCLACDKVKTGKKDWVESLDLFAQVSDGTYHFIHESIPRERAITLGVKPLLDTLLQGLEDGEFMTGSVYGQHEDLCDRLKSILNKYPADYSILNEFLQNADDARATEIVFILDHRKFSQDRLFPSKHRSWKKLQETPALLVVNNSKFTEEDIQGIAKLGRGGKRNASDTIGRFGIGFNVAYHVTDCPSFLTFSENGEPENFCVFDPTCMFANTTKRNPGKRWQIQKNPKVVNDLSPQFQPFLLRDISTSLVEDVEKEHVVFRLPLTRRPSSIPSRTSYTTYPYQHVQSTQERNMTRLSKASFGTSEVSKLFKDMERYAHETLLFLNHVHRISAVEIGEDGNVITHFKTHLTVSPEAKAMCTAFAIDAKKITKRQIEPKPLSIIYETEIIHLSKTTESSAIQEKQKWLICRKYSPLNLVQQAGDKKCQNDDREWNMRPIGGVAAALGKADIEGRLFCFLPMPLRSKLPVHVNGHFLVDDSRKHLEEEQKEGLNWNVFLAKNVIAPCYVDMLLHAQTIAQSGEAGIEWFYKLFPQLNSEGEVGNLKLPESVYSILHQKNPPILLQKHPQTGEEKWLTLSGQSIGYFFLQFISKETNVRVKADPELRVALLDLGLPVVTAEVPLSLYNNLKKVNETYSVLVRPELIIRHMKGRISIELMEKILTLKILQLFLQFLIESRKICFLKDSLSEVPLILTADSHLKKCKTIFRPAHASLLPHFPAHFILRELEESSVGRQMSDSGVIVDLPVAFVRDNISLMDTYSPMKITDISSETLDIVSRFWLYMESRILVNITDIVRCNFRNKLLIPADDGYLYPVSFYATVLCSAGRSAGTNRIRSALDKLGYPTLSFKALKIAEPNSSCLVVNSCSDGSDIIDCFRKRSPPNESADLSYYEVRQIIDSVRDHEELDHVRETLRCLKVFKTVSGEFMSMKDNPRVFVMQHDMPRDGIQIIQEACKTDFMILDATDELTMEFYKRILRYIADEKVAFYRQVILPHMPKLHVNHIQNHMKHIFHNSDLKREFQEDLREIKLIKMPSGEFCRIEELCHPESSFFKTFCTNRLLPDPWKKHIDEWILIFKELGFRLEVGNQELIDQCKSFAAQSSKLELDENVISQSRILLETFLDNVGKNHFHPHSYEVKELSVIPFLHNSAPEPALIREIKTHFGANVENPWQLFSFSGSVFSSQGNLAALCRRILPFSCEVLNKHKHSAVCNNLGIESPVSAKTIVCNLKKVSSHYTCIQMSARRSRSTTELRKMLEQHFNELNKLSLTDADMEDLKETLCIPVAAAQSLQSLVLVRSSQLIRAIPSGMDLEPFCYKVPDGIAACGNLLRAFGVPEETAAKHCIDILQIIHKQLLQAGKVLSSHNKFKEIALYSYDQLVCSLRKGECESLPEDLPMPSEDDELVPCHELVFNDAPWYARRLPEGQVFKFLKFPPPDSNGEKIPPKSLGVSYLTSLISEELHKSMKSEGWMCNHELCYARDSSKPRCTVVQNILDTLQSEELKDGLLRVYYHERKERPPAQFEETLQRLAAVEVTCVTSAGVSTVLRWRDGDIIEGSKSNDNDIHCLALISSESVRLVIAPHNKHFSEVDFIQHLSKALNVILHYEIKNEAYLTAVFKCSPKYIERELDKQQVPRYDPTAIKVTKYLQAGDVMPLDELTFSDCLLILNFNEGEMVRYWDEKRSTLVAAEVTAIRESERYQETVVTLSVNETNDDQNSQNESTVQVTPACIFKILTPPQAIVLFSSSSDMSQIGATAEPIALTPISNGLEEINSLLASGFFNGVPREMIVLRLVVQIHYPHNIQKSKLNENVVQFLNELECFLKEENQIQPLAHYVLQIVQNNLKIGPHRAEGFISAGTPRYYGATTYYGGSSGATPHYGGSSGATPHYGGSYGATPYYGGSYGATPHYGGGYSSAGSPQVMPQQVNQPPTQSYQSQSRFQPQPRRAGQPSRHRQQRYYNRFQDQYVHTEPAPPPTSERDAQIWLDQAKMDYKAALFMMGVTPLSPVVVPPPPQCIVSSEAVEAEGSKEEESEEAGEATFYAGPALESRSSESFISSLNSRHDGDSDAEIPNQEKDSSVLLDSDVGSDSKPSEGDDGAEGLVEKESLLESISSLQSEHEEGGNIELKRPEFPSLVCFLCHEAVEKSMKGVMFAYCGLSTDLMNFSALVSILEHIKASSHFPQHLIEPIANCVMQVTEHQNRSRYPNCQIPPCAPAAVYTTANAREALKATKKLFDVLMADHRIAPLLKGLEDLPAPQFSSMLLSHGGNDADYPSYWEPHADNEEIKLFLLDMESDESQRVEDHFMSTLPSAEVKQIHRIQNRMLWKKYINKSRELNEFGGVLNEKLLFHGSRSNEPELIYKGDASFDMRFSRNGLWGKGNYFAVNASYSDSYAYQEGGTGLRKILAAWVLTGHSYEGQPHQYTHPPFLDDSDQGSVRRRYDSVTGTAGGSTVYITYENTLAYPIYLITYARS